MTKDHSAQKREEAKAEAPSGEHLMVPIQLAHQVMQFLQKQSIEDALHIYMPLGNCQVKKFGDDHGKSNEDG
jgi:hypothetical protein